MRVGLYSCSRPRKVGLGHGRGEHSVNAGQEAGAVDKTFLCKVVTVL